MKKKSEIDKASPVHKERLGALEAAVWENEVGEGRSRMRVTLQKSFKDAEGTWQRSHSLDAEELPLATRLLDRCESWIARQQQRAASPASATLDEEQEHEREP